MCTRHAYLKGNYHDSLLEKHCVVVNLTVWVEFDVIEVSACPLRNVFMVHCMEHFRHFGCFKQVIWQPAKLAIYLNIVSHEVGEDVLALRLLTGHIVASCFLGFVDVISSGCLAPHSLAYRRRQSWPLYGEAELPGLPTGIQN